MREFLHADDLGEACVFAQQSWSANISTAFCNSFGQTLAYLNVGIGIELSICQLPEQIAEVVGFQGRIDWDASKPDVTPKK